MHLLLWQWAILVTASFLIGVSKTGITGLSTFAVSLFALVLPTRSSVGIVLVILISADVIAVTLYRHHAIWSHLWRLFPWAAAGIILGYFAIGRIDDRQVSTLVGAILLVMAVVQWWRQRRTARGAEDIPDSFWFAATIGMLAGFTTMVANAAV